MSIIGNAAQLPRLMRREDRFFPRRQPAKEPAQLVRSAFEVGRAVQPALMSERPKITLSSCRALLSQARRLRDGISQQFPALRAPPGASS